MNEERTNAYLADRSTGLFPIVQGPLQGRFKGEGQQDPAARSGDCYSSEGDIARVEWYMPSKKLSLCHVLLVWLLTWYTAGVSNVRSHVSTAQERCPGEEG